jgi:hypothetical protein
MKLVPQARVTKWKQGMQHLKATIAKVVPNIKGQNPVAFFSTNLP